MKTFKYLSLLIVLGFFISISAEAQVQKNIPPPPPPKPKKPNTDVFLIVEEMPEPNGGMTALYDHILKNTRYPEVAKKANITGRVFLQFIVEKDGSISNIKAIKTPHESLTKEAIRVLKAFPDGWQPGKQRDNAVRVKMSLPFKFDIPKKQEEEVELAVTLIDEQNPEPIGGNEALYKFIGKNMKYPKETRKAGIEGKVYLQFVVEKDGSINDTKVLKSPHPSLSEEAIRVFKAYPDGWKAGTRNGEAVKTKMTIPIAFKLDNKKTDARVKAKDISIKPDLVIIDDIRYEAPEPETLMQVFQSIDPNQIKSIEVLKGEAAKPIYGEAAENGVIIIKLKKTEEIKEQTSEKDYLSIYPNPTQNIANFSLDLPKEAQVRIEAIIDNTPKVIVNRRMPAGKRAFKWNTENLRAGVYLIKVQVDQEVSYKRLVVR